MHYYYHKDAIHVSKIDLLVSNLKRSKQFYTESLGFTVLKETETYISLTVDFDEEIIRLHQDEDTNKADQSSNIYHFNILLPTRRDLGKFLHHLILKQIPIDGAADHLVSEAIYLKDPDGIGIEISCDKDDDTWEKDNQQIKMDSLPFDYKGVYYAVNETDLFSTLPVDTTIGHLHLQVDDLDKTKAFYQNVIGFNIVNEAINDAVFMSDKNYHHHLAINSWKKEKDQSKKMKSFTITYPNCEKFKKTYETIMESNMRYQETNDGIAIEDPENTKIYLSIK